MVNGIGEDREIVEAVYFLRKKENEASETQKSF